MARDNRTVHDSAPARDWIFDPSFFALRDEAFAAIARGVERTGNQSLSFSYSRHGPRVFLSGNVTARDAETAEKSGQHFRE